MATITMESIEVIGIFKAVMKNLHLVAEENVACMN